ncbi:hypothetical protein EMCRGX_G012175 [Ephydatia muelleri]
MLRNYIQEKKEKWDDDLDTCSFAYNTSKHESTKFTPFEIIFGRKAILPLDLDAGVHQGPCNEAEVTICSQETEIQQKESQHKALLEEVQKTLFLLRRNRRSSLIRNTQLKLKATFLWLKNEVQHWVPGLTTEDKKMITSGGWLSDQIVDAGQKLLKSTYPQGLQEVALGMVLSYSNAKSEFIQIMNTGKHHWITVSNINCNDEEIHVYDCASGSPTSSMNKSNASLKFGNDVNNMAKLVDSIQLALIGDSGVGKTCVVTRYADNQFKPPYEMTIGNDIKVKKILLNGKTIKLLIWDTGFLIPPSIYRGALGIFVLYDLTMRHSFERVKFWLTVIETNASASGLEMMLVATKCDDWPNREVTTTEGMRFAEEHHMAYIETSARSNHNITEAFEIMARNICAKRNIMQSQRMCTETGLLIPEDCTETTILVPEDEPQANCCFWK